MKKFADGFAQGSKEFGESLAIIVNSALLTIVYFLGIGITSVACKNHGKKFIFDRPDKSMKSYWSDASRKKGGIHDSYRQF